MIQIIGDLPEDQKKILRIHSLIVSEKLKVPTQRNKLSFQVKINDDDPPDIQYFRYPKIDEIYQLGLKISSL